MVTLYTLVSVLVVSLISLVGVFTMAINPQRLQRIVYLLVSIAAGALFGDAFIHILPEAFSQSSSPMSVSFSVLGGIFLFFILEKVLRWHHAHNVEDEVETDHMVGKMNLLSDGLHNLIDGILIGSSYLVSIPLGIATTLAVAMHELPQEIGDFGVLLHAGYTPRRALLFNFLSASVAILGAVAALMIGSSSQQFIQMILPLTAGSFIYIALADLVPEMQKEHLLQKSLFQFLGLFIGVGMMYLLLLLES